MRRVVGLGAVLVVLAWGQVAQAAPILGGKLFYTGGTINIEVLGVGAAFNSAFNLYDDSLVLRIPNIVNSLDLGTSVALDPGSFSFGIGDELVFGITVFYTGAPPDPVQPLDVMFYMGPAGRNPDNVIHAQRTQVGPMKFLVEFEDLLGGGDLDYNDVRFEMDGGVVPEPSTLLLVGTGLAAAAYRRRRKR